MKKILMGVCCFLLICGCSKKPSKTDIAIKVNNYVMTAQEFEEEFVEAKKSRGETLQSKENFANEIITRKALLQEAQNEGIDKERDFLKSIEHFWEQSLITILLERETRRISANISVSDEEIADFYSMLPEEQRNAKSQNELHSQIQTILLRQKESKELNDWIDSLNNKSKIEINKEILDKK